MAFKGRRRFSRGSSNARRRLWTAANSVDTLTHGSALVLNIVVPDDYRDAASMEPSNATLLRVRGSFGISPIVGNLLTGTMRIHVAMFVVDVDAGASVNPTTAQDLIDEQVLYNRIFNVTNVASGNNNSVNVDVDVKAKRILRDDVVMFVISPVGTVGDDLSCVQTWRALILK